MNKIYVKLSMIIIICNLSFGCQSLKDGLEGNKKSHLVEGISCLMRVGTARFELATP